MNATYTDKARDKFLQEARNADAAHLRKGPALTGYIERIGAVQRSFRHYVVEEDGPPAYGTLRRSVAEIRIKDGILSVQ